MTNGLCSAAPRQARLQGIHHVPLGPRRQRARTLQRPRQNGLNAAKLGNVPLDEYKRKREIDTIKLRPHPWEFYLYFDT